MMRGMMRNDDAGGSEDESDEEDVDPDPLAGVSAEDRTAILKAQMEELAGCCRVLRLSMLGSSARSRKKVACFKVQSTSVASNGYSTSRACRLRYESTTDQSSARYIN